MKNSYPVVSAFLCALVLTSTRSLQAATYHWDTATGDSAITEGSGTWQEGVGNWSDTNAATYDLAWSNGNDAVFGGGTAGTAGTVTLGSNVAPSKITFDVPNAGHYTIDLAGNTLTLPDVDFGITGNSGFGPATILDSAGDGSLVTTGNNFSILLTGTNATGDLTIDAKITGAGRVLARGGGSLTLNNPSNDFTGTLHKFNGGNLTIPSIKNSGIPSAAGAGSDVRLHANGTLNYTGPGDTTDRTLVLFSSGDVGVNGSGTGPLVWTGIVSNESTLSRILTFRGDDNTISNEIQSVLADNGANILSVNRTGQGLWILSATNTFLGNITSQNQGTLRIGGAGQLGAIGNYAGNISVTQNGKFDYSSSANQNLFGNISGTGQLIQNGPGTLTISGTSSHSGNTTVNGGVLIHNVANPASAFTVNPAGVLYSASSLGSLNLYGQVSAGSASNTVGSLGVSALTLRLNGRMEVDFADGGNMNGTAGTDWDVLNVGSGTGTTTVSAVDGSEFVMALKGSPGFDNGLDYTNVLIAGGAVSGFDVSKFTIDTSEFIPGLGSGGFTLDTDGGDIRLIFLSAGIATFEWDAGGGVDRDWFNGANWTADTIPSGADDAYVNGTHTAVVAFTGTDVSNLFVGSTSAPSTGSNPTGKVEQTAGIITISSTLVLGDSSTGEGTYEITGGELVMNARSGLMTINSNSLLDINGGTVSKDMDTTNAINSTFGIGLGTVQVQSGGLQITNGVVTEIINLNPLFEISGGDVDLFAQTYIQNEFKVIGESASIDIGWMNAFSGSHFIFEFGPAGVSPIDVFGWMVITNSQITVDGSAYTGGAGVFPLIDSSALASLASNDSITVTGFTNTEFVATVVQDTVNQDVLLVLAPPPCDVIYEATANWSSQVVDDHCSVIIRSNTTVTLDVSDIAASLTVNDSAAGITSALEVATNTLTINGNIDLGAGDGAGIVNQSGGSVSASNLAANASGSGDLSQYNLSGGDIAAGSNAQIEANGELNVSGGMFSTRQLNILSNGTVSLTGGEVVLSARSGLLTVFPNGLLDINGGILSMDIDTSNLTSQVFGNQAGMVKVQSGGLQVTNTMSPVQGVFIRPNMEISGGDVDLSGQVLVYQDFKIIGSAATIDFGWGNPQPGNEFIFEFDAAGISPINIFGWIGLTNAQITVDGSAYTGPPGEFPLFKAADLLDTLASNDSITVSGFALAAEVVQDLSNNVVKLVLTGSGPANPLVFGNGLQVADGDTAPEIADNTDFGTVSSDTTHHFLLANMGADPLDLGELSFVSGDTGSFAVLAQPSLLLISDDFTSGSVTKDDGRFRENDIDNGWNAPNKGEGSAWTITGGQMVNTSTNIGPYSSNDTYVVAEGPLVQMVTLSGQAGDSVNLVFDYDVAPGDQVYAGLMGYDGELDLDSDQLGNTEYGSGFYGNLLNIEGDDEPAPTTVYSMVDGTTPGSNGVSFSRFGPFTGSGTFITNINIAGLGIGGITNIVDFEYLSVYISKDEDGLPGTTSIDNLSVGTPVSTLNGGEVASFSVTFSPTNSSLVMADLEFTNNHAGTLNPYTFRVQGQGTPATPEVYGNGLLINDGDTTPEVADDTDFGMVSNSATHTFTILNAGASSLGIGTVTTNAAGNPEAFVITRQPGLSVLNDDFSASSVTKDDGRFRENDIDQGWQAADAGDGSDWSVVGGVLQNTATNTAALGYPGYIPAEGPVVQGLTLNGQAGASVNLSFTYDVASGDQLFMGLVGYDGELDLDSDQLGNTESSGGNLANLLNLEGDDEPAPTTAYSFMDGATPAIGSPFSKFGPFTGSGTYSTNITIADLSIGGIADLGDFEYLALYFSKVEDGTAGTTSIDNLQLGVPVTALAAGGSTSFDVTFTPPGSGSFFADIEFTNTAAGALNPYTFRVQGMSAGPVTNMSLFTDWATSFGLTGSDAHPTNDVDGDTQYNLVEYAHGGNPTNGVDDDTYPTFTVSQNGEGVLVFRRRIDYVARGLSYTVERLTNLVEGAWSTSGTAEDDQNPIDANFEEMTYVIDPANPLSVRLLIGLDE